MSASPAAPCSMAEQIELAPVAAGLPPETLPNLTVAYHNASVGITVSSSGPEIKTVFSPFFDFSRAITGKAESRTFWRLRNASGCIRPGTMTLILAPPGHGKSTLLRVLSDRLRSNTTDATSGVRYNGVSAIEAAAQGCSVRRLCHLVEQVDEHLPLLTVRETLDFAHECSSFLRNPARVDSVIRMLGLEECQNTILGDALTRGVSGGQKRRVTVGEMLVGDARAIFLDEYTNGLDTATSEDITRGLRKWARETNGSVVTTAQQPTPGLFAEYDDVIVLNDAVVIYHGPREDVVPFFASMGFACPDDVDVCDFIIDCVSQPRVAYERLLRTEARTARAAKASGTARDPAPVLASSKGQLSKSAAPCLTPGEMLAHYHASQFYDDMLRAVRPFFPALALSGGAEFAAESATAEWQSLKPSAHAKAAYATGFVQPVGTLLRLVAARQFTYVSRNKDLLFSRLAMVCVMGLFFGSVFYMVSEERPFVRLASALLATGQVSFANYAELPQAIIGFRLALRHSSSGFYPTWMAAVATTVTMMPFLAVETMVLSLFMYFMGGYVMQAGNLFTFFALLFVHSNTMRIYFAAVAAVTLSEAAVLAIAGPLNCVFMFLGGFFLSYNAMPIWMRWLMWLSPFSWTVRALVNNEFLSSRYDALTDTGVRIGDVHLNQLDIRRGVQWIGYDVLALVSVSLVLIAATAWLLQRPFFESSIGTRRADDEDVRESGADKAAEDARKEHDAAVEDEIAAELSGDAFAAGAAVQEASCLSRISAGTDTGADSGELMTLREALPFTPMWLSFSDLHYTVKVPGPDGGLIDRPLLRGVNGYAEPGKLTALMGASGAGKTTLLDVLAGRKNIGVVEGKILFNGRPPSPADVASHTGYVEQFDSLFPSDTVHETLLFAARLRLPASVPDDVKMAIVDEVLDILELAPIRGYIIGNADVIGLSPSQLKRVNIGCELVANPAIIFFDEPTTGLDSRAAQTVMRVIRRIARSGRSVICTIHQPSAELFYLFDRLVLLASGGHQVFFGSLGVRCKHFVPYIESIEGVSKCPPRYNPASWMLEEMGVGQASAAGDTALAAAEDSPSADAAVVSALSRRDDPRVVIERFKAAWLASRQFAVARGLLWRLEGISSEQPSAVAAPEDAHINDGVLSAAPTPTVAFDAVGVAAHDGKRGGQSPAARSRSGSLASSEGRGSVLASLPTAQAKIHAKDAPTALLTYWLLQKRMVYGYWRNPSVMFIRFVICAGMSLVFGLMYFGVEPTSQANVQSLMSATAAPALFISIMVAISAMPLLIVNRAVMYRELSSDMYRPWMWSLSSFLNEALWCVLLTLLAQVPNYFLVGLDTSARVFFRYWFVSYLLMVAFCGLACFLAYISPDMGVAGVLQTICLTSLNVLNGITVPLPNLPRGWIWVYHLSPVSHVTEALVMDQFATCSPLPNCGRMIDITQGSETTTLYLAAYVKETLGFGYDGYGDAVGWIILAIGVAQLVCVVAITKLNFSKR